MKGYTWQNLLSSKFSIHKQSEPAMYLRESWYVAAWSEAITRTLTPVRMLGESIVLYRTAAGDIAALEDACPHRKLPLSMGALKDDRIVCGYHGLTFDRGGACVAAPTQERIPTGARVRRYAAIERYGFVWLWMGDAATADESRLIDIPNYGDPAWGRTKGGDMPIACNYLYMVDNLLDPSHVAWVHVSSFAGAKTDNAPLTIDVGANGVTVWRWLMDTPPPAYYAGLVKFAGNADRKQHYECVLPGIGINMSVYAPAGHGGPGKPPHAKTYINISYNFMTPVDEDNTRYYWFQHRNTDPDDEAISETMNKGAYNAFIEDRDVLEAVHAGMANRRTPSLDLALDAGALRFRKLLKARIEAETASSSAAA
jgi:phenylpropionate dioxygenase-like ring-hydroxylating dioxygenase large terminal subunit